MTRPSRHDDASGARNPSRAEQPSPAGSADTLAPAGTVEALLAGTGVNERVVVEALTQLHAEGWFTRPPVLSSEDATFVDRHGGVRDNRDALVRARVAARVRDMALTAEIMTLDEAADYLAMTPAQVSVLIDIGDIYALPAPGPEASSPRIPLWQFSASTDPGHRLAPVPQLGLVVGAVPSSTTQVEVESFRGQRTHRRPGC